MPRREVPARQLRRPAPLRGDRGRDRPGDQPVTLHEWFEQEHETAITVDALSMTQVGTPGCCPHCGLVTIETAGFPHGEHRYKVASYCPDCTGGENVG